MSPVGAEALLDRVLRRQRGQFIILRASESFFADQSTLGLRALLRASAIPGALRRVAHMLAWNVTFTIQRARWLCASRAALRRGAILSLPLCARILGAEGRAVRSVAINLAFGVVWLWAAGLALRLLALRAAILIAHRLSAIPCAMWKARFCVRTVNIELCCIHNCAAGCGSRRNRGSIFGNRTGCHSRRLNSGSFTDSGILQMVFLVVSAMVLVMLVMGRLRLRLHEVHSWCLDGACRK